MNAGPALIYQTYQKREILRLKYLGSFKKKGYGLIKK